MQASQSRGRDVISQEHNQVRRQPIRDPYRNLDGSPREVSVVMEIAEQHNCATVESVGKIRKKNVVLRQLRMVGLVTLNRC